MKAIKSILKPCLSIFCLLQNKDLPPSVFSKNGRAVLFVFGAKGFVGIL